MNKCLQCGVDIESYTGRRPKKFCSDGCRATYHKKPRPKKSVTRGTFEKVVKEKAELAMELAKFKANHVGEAPGHKIDIQDLNIQTNKVEPKKPMGSTKSNFTINTTEPKEGTMAFFNKYGCMTWDGVEK